MLKLKTETFSLCLFFALLSAANGDFDGGLSKGLLHALSPQTLANVIKSVRIKQRAKVLSEPRPISSLEDGYNDELCFEQLEAIREGLNKTQMWAFRGKLKNYN